MKAPRPFGLRARHYALIVIDAPWMFRIWSDEGKHKSAQAQYSCMSIADIRELPVGELAAPDCLLLVWATAPLLPLQIMCATAWGFTYKSAIVWDKRHASGAPSIGTGYRVRSRVEFVLVATRGAPKHKAFPGEFEGVRRQHSRKPDEFYSLVDECCPALKPRADLFARERRRGWSSFGDELGKF